MSKCVLVMDMPEWCLYCQFHGYTEKMKPCCKYMEKELQCFYGNKPDWCPLKPMPSKKDKPTKSESVACFNKVYNACIDELLKGEEG